MPPFGACWARRAFCLITGSHRTLGPMNGRPTGPDDARPIPQGGAAAGGNPPALDLGDDLNDALGDDLGDGLEDDVYVVDVRGRRRESGSTRTRSASGAAGAGAMAGAGSAVAAPPAAPTRPQTAGQGEEPARRRRRFPYGKVALLAVLGWVAFMIFTPLHAWSTVTKVDSTPPG